MNKHLHAMGWIVVLLPFPFVGCTIHDRCSPLLPRQDLIYFSVVKDNGDFLTIEGDSHAVSATFRLNGKVIEKRLDSPEIAWAKFADEAVKLNINEIFAASFIDPYVVSEIKRWQLVLRDGQAGIDVDTFGNHTGVGMGAPSPSAYTRGSLVGVDPDGNKFYTPSAVVEYQDNVPSSRWLAIMRSILRLSGLEEYSDTLLQEFSW